MKKLFIAFLVSSLLVACGTPSTVTGLNIGTPINKLVLQENETIRLSVKMDGTPSSAGVTWSLEPNVGTLTGISTKEVTYNAPAQTYGRVVRITATSVDNPNISDSIFLGLQPQKAAVDGGRNHALATTANGTVLSWGKDDLGQLGDDAALERKPTPVASSGLASIVAVAAGDGHSLALRSNGTVYAWGLDSSGQLGNDAAFVNIPQREQVQVASQIIAIAAGAAHSLALKSDGTVLAWGNDASGQLGDNAAPIDRPTPAPVAGLTDVVAIAAGSAHSLALRANGSLMAWGNDNFGQLGDNSSLESQGVPVAVPGAKGIVAIAAGGTFSLALKSDGTVLAWGEDAKGQLGNNAALINEPTPVPVLGATNIVALAAGNGHALALKLDGSVLSWGWDFAGMLGNDTALEPKPTPVAVAGLTGIVAVGAGNLTSFAVGSSGQLFSWGDDSDGELGNDATRENQSLPVAVQLGANQVRLP